MHLGTIWLKENKIVSLWSCKVILTFVCWLLTGSWAIYGPDAEGEIQWSVIALHFRGLSTWLTACFTWQSNTHETYINLIIVTARSASIFCIASFYLTTKHRKWHTFTYYNVSFHIFLVLFYLTIKHTWLKLTCYCPRIYNIINMPASFSILDELGWWLTESWWISMNVNDKLMMN